MEDRGKSLMVVSKASCSQLLQRIVASTEAEESALWPTRKQKLQKELLSLGVLPSVGSEVRERFLSAVEDVLEEAGIRPLFFQEIFTGFFARISYNWVNGNHDAAEGRYDKLLRENSAPKQCYCRDIHELEGYKSLFGRLEEKASQLPHYSHLPEDLLCWCFEDERIGVTLLNDGNYTAWSRRPIVDYLSDNKAISNIVISLIDKLQGIGLPVCCNLMVWTRPEKEDAVPILVLEFVHGMSIALCELR